MVVSDADHRMTPRKRRRSDDLDKQGSNSSETSEILLPSPVSGKRVTRASKQQPAGPSQAHLASRESKGRSAAKSLLACRPKSARLKAPDAASPSIPAKRLKRATGVKSKTSHGRTAAGPADPLVEPARQGKPLQVIVALFTI